MYHILITLLVCVAICLTCFGRGPSTALPLTMEREADESSLPIEAQYALSAAIGRDNARYHALETAAGVELANPAHDLRLVLRRDDATLRADSLAWPIGLLSWGSPPTVWGFPDATRTGRACWLTPA